MIFIFIYVLLFDYCEFLDGLVQNDLEHRNMKMIREFSYFGAGFSYFSCQERKKEHRTFSIISMRPRDKSAMIFF